MNKIRVTRTALKEAQYCVAIGYCDIRYLMTGVYADFYTSGVYGWNFDAYKNGEYCITTGYRGMIGKNISSLVAPLEEEARKSENQPKMDDETWEEYGKRKLARREELRNRLWDIVRRNA